MNTCNVCNKDYDSLEDNIGLQIGICHVCNVNKLTDVNCKVTSQRLCKKCYNKSFACNKRSKYFSEKNKITPRKVFKNSNIEYKFCCDICNHTFESILRNISKGETWCPYCNINLLYVIVSLTTSILIFSIANFLVLSSSIISSINSYGMHSNLSFFANIYKFLIFN